MIILSLFVNFKERIEMAVETQNIISGRASFAGLLASLERNTSVGFSRGTIAPAFLSALPLFSELLLLLGLSLISPWAKQ